MMRDILFVGFVIASLSTVHADDRKYGIVPDPVFEIVPDKEAEQIDELVNLTLKEMKVKYVDPSPILRGVHPKDHGCVSATFQIVPDLPEVLRVGVFARPGHEYAAMIRYSNSGLNVEPDSDAAPVKHRSRGMAIKLMGVEGTRLVPRDHALAQDFLLVNHQVFASANVEDYLALRRNFVEFFTKRTMIGGEVGDRARRTREIVARIGSSTNQTDPKYYQRPPASPEQNDYFSGAPYLYGKGRAMKYRVTQVTPQQDVVPDLSDKNYLRNALTKRLTAAEAKPIVLHFQVQIRTAEELAGKMATEIEDACTEWSETTTPYVTVAKITIPPQDFNTPEAMARCEALVFNPWHGVREHQPLGGINRLKLAVYEASSKLRAGKTQ